MKKKIYLNKNKFKVKSIKSYKIRKGKTKTKYFILIKICLIFILSILFFIFHSLTNINYSSKNAIIINGKKEELNPLNLPLNEHYKILFPKVKYHPPRENVKIDEFFKLKDSYDYKKMKETGKDKYIYHTCVVSMAKYENLYARQFVEYYLKMGVEKFYFGDDNPENVENLGDVLSDYVQKGIVDIEYINHLHLFHHIFVEHAFENIKFRCKWFIFFDIDEYLEFTDKNMNIRTYLDMPIFDKCDTIKIHWYIHDDNNLLYYDERPLMERLNHSLPHHSLNVYHKPIVRGKDYGALIFPDTAHQPDEDIVHEQCDALGNIERLGKGILGSPKFDLCRLSHFTFKTSEEFAIKLLRGVFNNIKYDMESKLNDFNSVNPLTEEKIKVIENIVNRTFPKFHKN